MDEPNENPKEQTLNTNESSAYFSSDALIKNEKDSLPDVEEVAIPDTENSSSSYNNEPSGTTEEKLEGGEGEDGKDDKGEKDEKGETGEKDEKGEIQKKPSNVGVKYALPKRDIYLIFFGLMLSLLLAALDSTIVSTALPTIARDLNATQSQYSWVQIAYLLTFTALAPSYGRLSDMFGRKNVYMFCIVDFLVGSILSGASPNIIMLITCRALQGVGGGGLMSLNFIIIADIVSLRERGKYVGFMGATFGISSVAGPFLGGIFTDQIGWRWIFYINIPIGIVALVVVFYGLRKLHKKVEINFKNLDILGTLLIVGAVIAFLLGILWGGSEYAWSSPIIISLLVVGGVLVIPIIIVERYTKFPIIPLRMFRNRNAALSIIISFLVGFVMMSSMLYLPLWFQTVLGQSATMSGVQMLPMMFGLILASTTSGILVTKFGHYRTFPIVGTILASLGTFLLYLLDENSNQGKLIPFLILIGVGIGLILQIMTVVAQNSVEIQDVAVVTSAVSFFRTLGGVFGIAIGSVILVQEEIHFTNQAISNGTIPNPLHIFVQSMQIMWVGLAPFAAVAIPLSLFVRQVSLRKTVERSVPLPE